MKPSIGIVAFCVVLLMQAGCSYLFYPRADDYARQAKGTTAVDTLLNLTSMLEASAAQAKGGKGKDQALDDYHNQLHALFDTIDTAVASQITPPTSDLLITHKKTLRLLFHRLWALKDQQPQRDQHLNRCLAELRSLREALQGFKKQALSFQQTTARIVTP
ncbi:MAG: hypothetical protein NNA24_06955 [Nitrospira sp.]|nr:hypothetical protein [Nitrospira sp.]